MRLKFFFRIPFLGAFGFFVLWPLAVQGVLADELIVAVLNKDLSHAERVLTKAVLAGENNTLDKKRRVLLDAIKGIVEATINSPKTTSSLSEDERLAVLKWLSEIWMSDNWIYFNQDEGLVLQEDWYKLWLSEKLKIWLPEDVKIEKDAEDDVDKWFNEYLVLMEKEEISKLDPSDSLYSDAVTQIKEKAKKNFLTRANDTLYMNKLIRLKEIKKDEESLKRLNELKSKVKDVIRAQGLNNLFLNNDLASFTKILMYLITFWESDVKLLDLTNPLFSSLAAIGAAKRNSYKEVLNYVSSSNVAQVFLTFIHENMGNAVEWLLTDKQVEDKAGSFIKELAINKQFKINGDVLWPLGEACKAGATSVVKILIEQGYSLTVACAEDNSRPLLLACRYAHPETVEVLLNKAKELSINEVAFINAERMVNDKSSGYVETETALLAAVRGLFGEFRSQIVERYEIVASLIKKGNMNITGKCAESGWKEVTALYWAFVRGQREIAELLLYNGATFVAPNAVETESLAAQESAKKKLEISLQDYEERGKTNAFYRHFSEECTSLLKLLSLFNKLKDGDPEAWDTLLASSKIDKGTFVEKIPGPKPLYKESPLYDEKAVNVLYVAVRDGNLGLLKLLKSFKNLGISKEGKVKTFRDLLLLRDKKWKLTPMEHAARFTQVLPFEKAKDYKVIKEVRIELFNELIDSFVLKKVGSSWNDDEVNLIESLLNLDDKTEWIKKELDKFKINRDWVDKRRKENKEQQEETGKILNNFALSLQAIAHG
ncbi:TPA: hypothetical protein DDZ86_03755 [Candidatus Dependentiae bacterium]|nr:MAG: hypothetical protein UW09_C0003G0105 [candidate division TM6 bacterium GW2011_GWF2_43_87]HBL98731.1 hypothetical protein [Candidatus Dependentiae bacterium]